MGRTALASTLTVCVLAAVATTWLGFESGLFPLAGSQEFLVALSPYLGLALLAWSCRRRPIPLGILFALSVLVSGFGLFFYDNDWYWPRPTNPNPWRSLIIEVIVISQWLAVGVAAMILLACHLYARWHGASSAKPSGFRTL